MRVSEGIRHKALNCGVVSGWVGGLWGLCGFWSWGCFGLGFRLGSGFETSRVAGIAGRVLSILRFSGFHAADPDKEDSYDAACAPSAQS